MVRDLHLTGFSWSFQSAVEGPAAVGGERPGRDGRLGVARDGEGEPYGSHWECLGVKADYCLHEEDKVQQSVGGCSKGCGEFARMPYVNFSALT